MLSSHVNICLYRKLKLIHYYKQIDFEPNTAPNINIV